MAENQPDIVAITEVNPKGQSYKIEDIKIQDYITFESNLRCVGRRGSACSLITGALSQYLGGKYRVPRIFMAKF